MPFLTSDPAAAAVAPGLPRATTPLTVVRTLTLVGVQAVAVRVECAVSGGLPGLRLVGLPDVAVREAGERVRAAIQRSGLRWPATRILVNLAPADVPKGGSGLDLPLALAILAATGQLDGRVLEGRDALWAHGELGLDGTLRPVPSFLAVAVGARRLGAGRLLAPLHGSAVADAVVGLTTLAAWDLRSAVALAEGRTPLSQPPPSAHATARATGATASTAPPAAADERDLREVRGQPVARRAVEIAAAGGHHLLFVGPPGCGKSMLAARLVGLLPDLTPEAALEVAAIHSVAGGPHAIPTLRPPVRAPQTGASAAALLGGGAGLARPGELSLAHRGVLLLDELLETPRAVLDALRQPLEQGEVVIDRARGRVVFPAGVQLVATTNPCPCGFAGHPTRACTCPTDRVERYRARLSGPLLDRFDLQLALRPVPRARLVGAPDGEPTVTVAARVQAARVFSGTRQGAALNRDAPLGLVEGSTTPAARELLADGLEALGASARGFDRVLRVARTIADLASSERVTPGHVAEALALRLPALPR
jgi:magnesium chelatase family protein